jgi:hypothetical protein
MKNIHELAATAKQTAQKILIVSGLIVAFIGGIWLLGGVGQAQDAYAPQSPAVQATLDAFEQRVLVERCTLIKKLATAKLEDDMRSPITGIDRNDLAAKRDMNCDF